MRARLPWARLPWSFVDLPDAVAAAAQDADLAGRQAGVRVVTVHDVDGINAARSVIDRVWRPIDGGTQVTADVMRAVEHAGGYVSVAHDTRPGADPSAPVGVGFGVLGRRRMTQGNWLDLLHSHMVAALDGHRDRHIGTAIKQHQRHWCLRREIGVVTWTFDPLARRNMRFNTLKLGATAAEYLVDFYGEIHDEINAGDPSDRLLAWWALTSGRATEAAAGRLAAVPDGTAGIRTVPLPEDIVALRRVDPAAALRWRLRVRDDLVPAMADGWVIDGVTGSGDIVLRPTGRAGS